MSPQFEAILVFVVMSILVMLFSWIYFRDPQPKIRLWMFGWTSIFIHFAAPLVGGWLSIPHPLVDWIKIATLEIASACFLLSVWNALTSSRRNLLVYLGGVALASVVYLTAVLAAFPGNWLFTSLLIVSIATITPLVLRDPRCKSWYLYAVGLLLLCYGVESVWESIKGHHAAGLYFYLSLGFGLIGPAYWLHFRRVTPGVTFTSLSFLAWGLVWPVAVFLGAAGPAPSSFFWDLPKYFVAFGMIITLFETHADYPFGLAAWAIPAA